MGKTKIILRIYFFTICIFLFQGNPLRSYAKDNLRQPESPTDILYQSFSIGGDSFVNCTMEEGGQDGIELIFSDCETFDSGNEMVKITGDQKEKMAIPLPIAVTPEEYPYVKARSFVYANEDHIQNVSNAIDVEEKVFSEWSEAAQVSETGDEYVDLWIGDSRTVAMFAYLFADYEEHIKGDSFPQSIMYKRCLAKDGEGFRWMTEVAYPEICKLLDEKPDATLVFNMGVNDCDYVSPDTYISFYQDLIEEYPEANLYFMSINPLKEGYTDYERMTEYIDAMNLALRKEYGDHYINVAGYFRMHGFETEPDCIHYVRDTCKKIHNFTLQYIRYME